MLGGVEQIREKTVRFLKTSFLKKMISEVGIFPGFSDSCSFNQGSYLFYQG